MIAAAPLGLQKRARLCSSADIRRLFTTAKCVSRFPICLYYRPVLQADSHRVLFAVPKRRVRRAVRRNAIKRRLREAYRLNQHLLSPVPPCHLAILYVGTTSLRTTDLHAALVHSLKHIAQTLVKHPST